MMPRGWRESPPLQIALASLALASALTIWTLGRAFRVAAIEPPPVTAIASLDHIRGATSRTATDIGAVADNDLFSIDRSAPAGRYRMPGDPDRNATPAPVPEKPTLLGTAIATDGRHFATVQLKNGTPKLVYLGDLIGEWTVRSIERGKIVLTTSAGQRADVTVSQPGI